MRVEPRGGPTCSATGRTSTKSRCSRTRSSRCSPKKLSGLGAPTLCAHAGPGFAAGTVAWYERGALISYEHVGGSSVAWDPDDGLGRPFDGTAASIAALGGKRVAKLFGSDSTADVLERQQLANRAVGGVLLRRAFHRLLGADPPELDDLAGLVARRRCVISRSRSRLARADRRSTSSRRPASCRSGSAARPGG